MKRSEMMRGIVKITCWGDMETDSDPLMHASLPYLYTEKRGWPIGLKLPQFGLDIKISKEMRNYPDTTVLELTYWGLFTGENGACESLLAFNKLSQEEQLKCLEKNRDNIVHDSNGDLRGLGALYMSKIEEPISII